MKAFNGNYKGKLIPEQRIMPVIDKLNDCKQTLKVYKTSYNFDFTYFVTIWILNSSLCPKHPIRGI